MANKLSPQRTSILFYFMLILIVLEFPIISRGAPTPTLVPIPAYAASSSLQKGTIKNSITLNGSAKYSGIDSGLSILHIKQSQSSASEFCSVKDRKLIFSLNRQTSLYTYQVDSNGFALTDVPAVISWQQLIVKTSLFNANFVNVDSRTSISLFAANPMMGTQTLPITTLSLTSFFTMQDIIMSGVFICQVGSSIFLAYEKSSTLQFLRVSAASSGTGLTAAIFSIPGLLTTLGSLADLTGYTLSDSLDEGVLLLLFETGLVGVHIKSGEYQKTLLIDLITGTDIHDFVNIRTHLVAATDYPPSPNPLQIYILCQNKGLYRYNLLLSTLSQDYAKLEYVSTFQISIAYGTVFNHYRGRIFFINTSADPYQTYEYEVILDNTARYYLNRMHDTDHKVKDIIVRDFYFILSGSNSQTVSWHSVHPTLVQDIVPKQQFYSIYGLSGGSILTFKNSTSNEDEEFFIGFQSRHIFMYKAIHIMPYLLCEPKTVSDPSSLVGQHQFLLTLVQQNYLRQNSYQVVEGQSNWILQVNEVYASSLTAGAIAGIVISVVVVFIGVMVLICWKIKRQRKQQQQLYQEINTLKQTGNFSALKEEKIDPQSDGKSSNDGNDINQGDQSFEKPKRNQFSSRIGSSAKSSDVNSIDNSSNNKENTAGRGENQVDKISIHVGDQQDERFVARQTPGELQQKKNEGEEDNKDNENNNNNQNENDIIQFVEDEDDDEDEEV